MKKIQVTQEEKDALDIYLGKEHIISYECQSKIISYITNSDTWTNSYKPLKNMGLEKFVKCLVQGYELEIPPIPKFENDDFRIVFNNNLDKLTNIKTFCFYFKNPYGINNYDKYTWKAINLDSAKELRKSLDNFITYYEKYGGKHE